MFLRSVEAQVRLMQDMKVPARSHFPPNYSGNNLKYVIKNFPHIEEYNILHCKGSTFICVHSQYQQNAVLL